MNATFAPVAPVPWSRRIRVAVGWCRNRAAGASPRSRPRCVHASCRSATRPTSAATTCLQYWEHDPDTDGDPAVPRVVRQPAQVRRDSRAVSLATKPIVALKSGRTLAGARGAASHTAALANPDVAVDELFRQAGVVRVDTLEQLFDTAALLVHQPLPRGPSSRDREQRRRARDPRRRRVHRRGLEVPELSDEPPGDAASRGAPWRRCPQPGRPRRVRRRRRLRRTRSDAILGLGRDRRAARDLRVAAGQPIPRRSSAPSSAPPRAVDDDPDRGVLPRRRPSAGPAAR